ncbi:hypothetical protein XENORESO_021569, partial [Xenotaenia resolanae]
MPPSPNTHQHHTLRDPVTNSFCWLIIPNFLPTLFYMRNTQPNTASSLLFALTGALSSSVFVKVSRRSAPFSAPPKFRISAQQLGNRGGKCISLLSNRRSMSQVTIAALPPATLPSLRCLPAAASGFLSVCARLFLLRTCVLSLETCSAG